MVRLNAFLIKAVLFRFFFVFFVSYFFFFFFCVCVGGVSFPFFPILGKLHFVPVP